MSDTRQHHLTFYGDPELLDAVIAATSHLNVQRSAQKRTWIALNDHRAHVAAQGTQQELELEETNQ